MVSHSGPQDFISANDFSLFIGIRCSRAPALTDLLIASVAVTDAARSLAAVNKVAAVPRVDEGPGTQRFQLSIKGFIYFFLTRVSLGETHNNVTHVVF